MLMLKAHPPEVRRRAVELAGAGGKSQPELARDLGISVSCLRSWVAQSDKDEARGAPRRRAVSWSACAGATSNAESLNQAPAEHVSDAAPAPPVPDVRGRGREVEHPGATPRHAIVQRVLKHSTTAHRRWGRGGAGLRDV